MVKPIRPDRFLVFGQPEIRQDEIDDVIDSMRSRWLGTGPKVAAFERDFVAQRGGHPVALNSCTAALHLAMVVLELKPGDEVITTPYTFCATVNAIIHAGGTPVLADVDPETWNIDPQQVEHRITDRTRAIVPVHFAGNPCDMPALASLADKHGLRIVEDCAHAVEAKLNGQFCGAFGDFGCFSFYATKNVSTGEGGMLVCRHEEDAERARVLSLHGMSRHAWNRFGKSGYRHYEVVEAGFKYNMMDLQAAIGRHQLARVEDNLRRREAIWARYDAELAETPLTLPPGPGSEALHGRHLYSVLVDEARARVGRDELIERMTAHGIGTGVHYNAIPEHRYYQERFGWAPEDTPVATRLGRQTVSIPLSPALSDDDVTDVILAIRDIVAT